LIVEGDSNSNLLAILPILFDIYIERGNYMMCMFNIIVACLLHNV